MQIEFKALCTSRIKTSLVHEAEHGNNNDVVIHAGLKAHSRDMLQPLCINC